MKPISLKLSGLHSYREPQEIDFKKLCEAGVFGIFGPTGSGKSTILDAITLALYGKVERAARSTQGILNHGEKHLTVSFTFEIGNPPDRRRYRVERRYVRDKGPSVRTSYCRLVECRAGSETVLGDREGEVTRQVQGILGLNADDFTRAVVLPQGRFAEFLSLKGTDRRQMLQRLFGLEAYGDRLNEKVKEQKTLVDGLVERLRGEQFGLGDASREAVEEAGRKLVLAREAAEATVRERHEADARWREMKQVWDWQDELDAVAVGEAQLQSRQDERAQAEVEVEAAERAEKVRPYLDAVEGAEEGLAGSEEALRKAEADLQGAADRLASAELNWKASSEERAGQEPELIGRRAALEGAKSLEGDVATLGRQVQDVEGGLARLVEDLRDLTGQLEETRGRKKTLESETEEARRRLGQISVPPEKRERVRAAVLALQAYRTAGEAEVRAQEDLTAKVRAAGEARTTAAAASDRVFDAEKAAAQAQAEFKRVQAARPADEKDLMDAAQALERARAEAREVESCLKEWEGEFQGVAAKEREAKKASRAAEASRQDLEARQSEFAAAREELKKAGDEALALKMQNHAAALAASLQPGEPCPVCGSREHPAPASAIGAGSGGYSAPADGDSGERLVPAVGADSGEHLTSVAVVGALAAEIAAAEERVQKAEGSFREAESRLSEAKDKYAGAQAKVAALSEALDELRQKAETRAAALQAARGKLREEWRELAPAALEAVLADQDAAMKARRDSLTAWQRSLEDARTLAEKGLQALNQARQDQAAAAANLKAAEAAAADSRAKLERAQAETARTLRELDSARGDLAIDDVPAEEERILACNQEAAEINRQNADRSSHLERLSQEIEGLSGQKNELDVRLAALATEREAKKQALNEKTDELNRITGGRPVAELLTAVQAELARVRQAEDDARRALEEARDRKSGADRGHASALEARRTAAEQLAKAGKRLEAQIKTHGFATESGAREALRAPDRIGDLRARIEAYRREAQRLADERRRLTGLLAGRSLTAEEWEAFDKRRSETAAAEAEAVAARGAAEQAYLQLRANHERWERLEVQRRAAAKRQTLLAELQGILRGNAFVEFLAEEQLANVALDASARLGQLTRYRYALEVDSEGAFIIRDDSNGGVRRPVSSLSGGETFLTSLALALALSAQIQLRGQFPLEFFFLDEGFGTLDPDLLEVAINALERLHLERLTIGVISHVPELRARLARRLVVDPAAAGGRGSRVSVEIA